MSFLISLIASIVGKVVDSILSWFGIYRQGVLSERSATLEKTITKEHEVEKAVEDTQSHHTVVDREWLRHGADSGTASTASNT